MLEELSQALSIKFNHSEDGSEFDLLSSPEKERQHPKVKCFRCFGTHQLNCEECHGTQMISFNHPLGMLLNEILTIKLNLTRSEEERQEELEIVQPIKEEEEDSEQKKMICGYCLKQCDSTCHECDHSPPLNFYTACTDTKINDPSEIDIKFLNCLKGDEQIKLCKNCSIKIENCYSMCKTCKDENRQYWLCGECSDSLNYTHPPEHIFEPVINYDITRQKNSIISPIFTEDEHEYPDTFLDTVESEEMNHPILSINSSIETNLGSLQRSTINMEIDDLFNSCEMQVEPKKTLKISNRSSYQQFYDKKPMIFFPKRSERLEKENIYYQNDVAEQEDYLFVDYKCDNCGIEPIVNIRYHCRLCSDYDLCLKCYPLISSIHEHKSFEEIDGRLLREKAMQKLLHLKQSSQHSNLAQTTRLKNAGKSMLMRKSTGSIL